METFKKKKILWVVYDFYQAGGQRYVYEICRALDKNKYEVDLLKVGANGYDKSWNKEYYYQLTLDLGCKLYFLDDILTQGNIGKRSLRKRVNSFFIRNFKKIIPGTSDGKTNLQYSATLIQNFLLQYDHINFSGLNVYRTLCIGFGFEVSNAIIHILTAQFQEDRSLFEGYSRSFPYHFVSSIAENNLKADMAGIEKYKFTAFPLSFETVPYEINTTRVRQIPFKIAIFTRLTAMKPLDPFFYALKLLLEKGLNVELEIYGSGDPVELGISRQLNYLYISSSVKFMGHAEDMPATLQTAGIDLVWFQSNNQLPAGYAALEIAMSGIPQVFWDFMHNGIEAELAEVYPCFTKITEFTNYTEKLLLSGDLRTGLGTRQREYIKKHHSIKQNIRLLEAIYDS